MSTLLRWRDSLALQVPMIDADHKRLFDLLNRVRFLDLAGDDPQAVAEALGELLTYTQTHFRREERLMELGHYPGIAQHRKLHEAFTDRIAEIIANFQLNPQAVRIRNIYEMLSNWLVDHVLGEDMRLKPYVAHLEDAQAA